MRFKDLDVDSHRNIGDCRDVSWDEMWQRFRATYRAQYSEHQLQQIHVKWKRLGVEIWGKRS